MNATGELHPRREELRKRQFQIFPAYEGTPNGKITKRLRAAWHGRGLTKRAPDAGDSAASQEVLPQSGESQIEQLPAATQRR